MEENIWEIIRVILCVSTFVLLGYLYYRRVRKYQEYIKIEAVLVDFKREYQSGDDEPYHTLTPIYEFEVDGKKYRCTSSLVSYYDFIKRHKILGRKTYVHYHPEDPTISVHRADWFDIFHSNLLIKMIVSLLLMILAFLLVECFWKYIG